MPTIAPARAFRVAQLTAPGSACPIGMRAGITKATRGSYEGMHLIVTDIEAARAKLVDRGARSASRSTSGRRDRRRLHPERADYGTFLSLSDPDGNGWLIQEVRQRAPGR